MPRAARLDYLGAMHHVTARGIEKRNIFCDDNDRLAFLARMARVVRETRAVLLAWCLMSNHVHLLLRTGPTPISSSMRRLLGGYAAEFNRRHRRVGHLFQNRFYSVVVEEETYLLEIVRYIHLNPVIAGLISIDHLDTYAWTGHAVLLGNRPLSEQSSTEVLGRFGHTVDRARGSYQQFVHDGWHRRTFRRFEGGGLRRSAGGWEAVAKLSRGRESWAFDERILGSGDFVARVLETDEQSRISPKTDPDEVLSQLLAAVAERFDLLVDDVTCNSKRADVVAARAVVSHVAVVHYQLAKVDVARRLGVKTQSVLRGVASAAEVLAAKRWDVNQVLAWARLVR